LNLEKNISEKNILLAIRAIKDGKKINNIDVGNSNVNNALLDLYSSLDTLKDKIQKESEAVANANVHAAEMMDKLEIAHEKYINFHNILNYTHDCIFIFNSSNLLFTYTNRGASLQVGYTAEELKKMTPLSIKPLISEKEFRKNISTLVNKSVNVLEFSTSHRHKDGHDIPVDIVLQYVETDKKFIAIVRDARKRIFLENKIIKTKEKAELAKLVTEHFLANMSHEIRTPMNGIIGFSNLLKNSQLDEEQQENIDMISKSSESLLIIINDILDYSKLESGMVNLEHISFDLSKLIEEIISFINQVPQVKEKELDIMSFGTDNINIVKGDPHRIKQVLINLLNNSIKFTDSGYVNLNLLTKDLDNGNVSIQLKVEDSGIGIDSKKLKTIFDKFSQADISDTRKYGGTGLGLSISKTLIELMGGTLEVKSEVDQGSIFIINLILERGKEELIIKKNDRSDKNVLYQGKVLVVEDNPINQKLITKTLKKLGLVSKLSENGKLGIKECRNSKFDLILMDLQMPIMDGFEATRKIREFNKTVPIVALTANVIGDISNECLKAGMNDFLTKPLKRNFLLDVLSKYTTQLE
jgi:PAS domain S-box-containing protein